MEAIAKSNIERISPMKVGWVIEHIKYKKVTTAFSILQNENNKAGRILFKILTAAVANATTNHGMSIENLYISYAVANPGSIMKRFRPRAKGSADKIDKKTTLIVIRVSDTAKKQNQKDFLAVTPKKSAPKKATTKTAQPKVEAPKVEEVKAEVVEKVIE